MNQNLQTYIGYLRNIRISTAQEAMLVYPYLKSINEQIEKILARTAEAEMFYANRQATEQAIESGEISVVEEVELKEEKKESDVAVEEIAVDDEEIDKAKVADIKSKIKKAVRKKQG